MKFTKGDILRPKEGDLPSGYTITNRSKNCLVKVIDVFNESVRTSKQDMRVKVVSIGKNYTDYIDAKFVVHSKHFDLYKQELNYEIY